MDGPTNMRRDLNLLDRLTNAGIVARIYSWTGAWVSLGRHQTPNQTLALPVPYVMRPTGGQAVLHGHDVTVGLAARLDTLLPEVPEARRERSLRLIYRRLVVPLANALTESGLPAVLAESTTFVARRHQVADCFASVSANDVVDPRLGVKVCGCAMRVLPQAVLIQCSIPTGLPLVDPTRVFRDGRPHPTPGCWNVPNLPDALERALEPLDKGLSFADS